MASDMEKLIEKFNQWADGSISDYEFIPTAHASEPMKYERQILARGRIETLQFAKFNLERLAHEIKR